MGNDIGCMGWMKDRKDDDDDDDEMKQFFAVCRWNPIKKLSQHKFA